MGANVVPFSSRRMLGTTGLSVSPIALGSSYGVGGVDIERAFDHGINLFLWGSRRRSSFGNGVRALGGKRDQLVLAIQSYARVGSLMAPFVHSALRSLKTDHVDLLGLAWWDDLPSRRILEAALALREQGKVRHLMISCHHRPTFESFRGQPAYEGWMVRYNAAHPGAEREVFPFAKPEDPARPGVLAFTATRWGSLLDPKKTPAGERTPRASDCYRFALTNPAVDTCIVGPKNRVEMDEAIAAIARGPMNEEELAWMKRVGSAVRGGAQASAVGLIDRLKCGRKTVAQLPNHQARLTPSPPMSLLADSLAPSRFVIAS